MSSDKPKGPDKGQPEGAQADAAHDDDASKLTPESERLIARGLKRSYDAHLAEPVPDVFTELLKRLEKRE